MKLPKLFSSPKAKKLEPLLIPAFVVLFLVVVVIIGIVIPRQGKKEKEDPRQKQFDLLTKPTKISSDSGSIQIPPRVQQISPQEVYPLMGSNQDFKVIHVYSKEEWKEPHIKGSLFIHEKDFDKTTSLVSTDKHVFVSSDGYASAFAINKLFNIGFPIDKNLNLEGGLNAWKKEGLPLEN